MSIRVTLHKLENAGPKQTKITNEACQLLEQALNHVSFHQRVTESEFTASWQRVRGEGSSERTPEEIAQLILMGQEANTDADYEIDLHLRLKKLRSWVIGSTALGRLPITTNYKFINRWIRENDSASFAAHIMHEWMHVAGFYHKGGNGARGDVAYVIGGIVYDVITEEIFDQSEAELI